MREFDETVITIRLTIHRKMTRGDILVNSVGLFLLNDRYRSDTLFFHFKYRVHDDFFFILNNVIMKTAN